MAHIDEIPSDREVVDLVSQHGDLSAKSLVSVLQERGHSRRDSQRAIQRCLDRGSLQLGSSMNLVVTQRALANAA